jgi:hypothetical protein
LNPSVATPPPRCGKARHACIPIFPDLGRDGMRQGGGSASLLYVLRYLSRITRSITAYRSDRGIALAICTGRNPPRG